MERRTFVHASAAGLLTAAAGQVAMADQKAAVTELYEHRVYSLKPAKQAALDEYLSKAFLPAVRRSGETSFSKSPLRWLAAPRA